MPGLKKVTTSIVDDQDPATATTLTRSHAYDAYGRLSTTTYPSSVTVTHEYNDRGYAAKLKHGSTALVNVTAQTAYGQSKAESYGNGVRTRRSYDEPGRLTDIDTIRRGAKIQDNTYAWRSDGSLQRRTARAGSRVKREYFAYDYLNRLKGATTYLGDSSTASRTLRSTTTCAATWNSRPATRRRTRTRRATNTNRGRTGCPRR